MASANINGYLLVTVCVLGSNKFKITSLCYSMPVFSFEVHTVRCLTGWTKKFTRQKKNIQKLNRTDRTKRDVVWNATVQEGV